MCGCGFILIVCANKRLIQEASLKAKSSKATLSEEDASLKIEFCFFVSHKLCCCVQASVCGGGFLLYFYFFFTSNPIFLCPTDCGLTGTECSHPEESGIR